MSVAGRCGVDYRRLRAVGCVAGAHGGGGDPRGVKSAARALVRYDPCNGVRRRFSLDLLGVRSLPYLARRNYYYEFLHLIPLQLNSFTATILVYFSGILK